MLDHIIEFMYTDFWENWLLSSQIQFSFGGTCLSTDSLCCVPRRRRVHKFMVGTVASPQPPAPYFLVCNMKVARGPGTFHPVIHAVIHLGLVRTELIVSQSICCI